MVREAGAAVSFSLKLVVSAEVICNTNKSLGGLMQTAKTFNLDMATLFALVSLAFLLGLVLELLGVWAANFVERRVK